MTSFGHLPAFLFPPEWVEQFRERERRAAERFSKEMLATPLQEWSANIKWAPKLHISAKSYVPFVTKLFDVPGVKVFSNDHVVRHGKWGYQNILLPKGEVLPTCLGARAGHVVFDDDVVIPTLWRGTNDQVWMSLTPMEVLSQRPGFAHAKGSVMIGGLGMGWALREIAKLKRVSKLIVAERSEDLLDWFGRKLIRQIAEETGKQIDLVVGDAFEIADKLINETDPSNRVDSFIFDIWQSYGSARGDHRWDALRETALAKKKRAWAWGASGAPNRENA